MKMSWRHDRTAKKVIMALEISEEDFFGIRLVKLTGNSISQKLEVLAAIARRLENYEMLGVASVEIDAFPGVKFIQKLAPMIMDTGIDVKVLQKISKKVLHVVKNIRYNKDEEQILKDEEGL